MAQTARNIDPETWGTEIDWFDWTLPITPSGLSFSTYSSNYYNEFKAMELKSPYQILSLAPGTNQAEINRVTWRGQWYPDMYGASDVDPDTLKFKTDKALKPEQFPCCWGFGLNSAQSNIFCVFPGYAVEPFDENNHWKEAQVNPFWFSITENYGPSPEDMQGDTMEPSGKPRKPMPFVPLTGLYVSPDNALQYSRRTFKCMNNSQFFSTYAGYPWLSFNYQKVVMVPCIYAAKYDSTQQYGITIQGPYTVEQYFDGINWDPDQQTGTPPIQDTYPLIVCVKISKLYVGSETEYQNKRRALTNAPVGGMLPDTLNAFNYPSTLIRVNGNYGIKSTTWCVDVGSDSWQTAVPYVLADGIISGMSPRIETYNMSPDSAVNDQRKAYIMSTLSNSSNVKLLHQNGHYTIYMVQQQSPSTPNNLYRNNIGYCAVWENATKEEVLKDCAYVGFWFTEDESVAQTGLTGINCNSSKMHIPLFDSEGLTTGEYKSGTDAALEDNAKWQDPFKDNDKYNPGKGERDDGDTGDLDSSIPIRGGNTAGLRLWVVSQSDLYDINAYLNGTYLPDITQSTADFKGSNPQEYIVSIQKYPFSLPHISTKDYIHIGKLNTGVEGYPFANGGSINGISIVDFGTLSVPYYFNDFRDFESTIVIQLPFIGAYELDPRVYVGHTVSLKYNIDYATGNVCAMIYRDNLIVETFTGTISVSVPLFASNMGAYQNTLASLQFAVDQSKTKQIAGIAATALSIGGALAAIPTGGMSALAAAGIAGGLISGTSSMVSGLIQQQELEYKIDHTQPHTASVSTASAANSFLLDDRARLLIYRPRMLNYDDAVYSHTVGNACCLTGVVGDFEGLIKCGNVDLSGIPATADEIKAIGDALASGVYV